MFPLGFYRVDLNVAFESVRTEHYHHRNHCLATTLPIAPSMSSNGVFFGSIDDIGSRMSSDRYGCIAAVGHSGSVGVRDPPFQIQWPRSRDQRSR
jgi:hypothetical protein